MSCRAPVAQLDRTPAFEAGRRGFESLQARHSLFFARTKDVKLSRCNAHVNLVPFWIWKAKTMVSDQSVVIGSTTTPPSDNQCCAFFRFFAKNTIYPFCANVPGGSSRNERNASLLGTCRSVNDGARVTLSARSSYCSRALIPSSSRLAAL